MKKIGNRGLEIGSYIEVIIAGVAYVAEVLDFTDKFVYANVMTGGSRGQEIQRTKENFLLEQVRPLF